MHGDRRMSDKARRAGKQIPARGIHKVARRFVESPWKGGTTKGREAGVGVTETRYSLIGGPIDKKAGMGGSLDIYVDSSALCLPAWSGGAREGGLP